MFVGIGFVEVDRSETHLGFHFEVKFRPLSRLVGLFSFDFSHFYLRSGADMTEVNQSTAKIMNIHQSKIDVVKFDDTNNFDMWRCKVMDALNAQNL